MSTVRVTIVIGGTTNTSTVSGLKFANDDDLGKQLLAIKECFERIWKQPVTVEVITKHYSYEQLIDFQRGKTGSDVPIEAIHAKRNCYVQSGGDVAMRDNMIKVVAHLLDQLEKYDALLN